jgi:hypothetical protein
VSAPNKKEVPGPLPGWSVKGSLQNGKPRAAWWITGKKTEKNRILNHEEHEEHEGVKKGSWRITGEGSLHNGQPSGTAGIAPWVDDSIASLRRARQLALVPSSMGTYHV